MLSVLLVTTLILAGPLILAALGGYTSERTGVINIGLEGMMLSSAAVTALVSLSYGAYAGVAAGLLAACSMSLLHWLLTQKYGIDQVISGMAINAIALGGTNYLNAKFPGAGAFPHFSMTGYVLLALLLPGVLAIYASRTRGGLRMTAVGADPDKSRLMGLKPSVIRFYGLVATGILTGLAGAMLVSDVETFTDNMTAGRGYIALAALIVGGWRPIPASLVCLLFGFLNALQVALQGTSFLEAIPRQAWAALPYVVTLVALAGFLGKSRTPAGLGKL